uniref:Uncharacterized protein n=1 Tax=Rangifer tarandus platyrhynchus TaxID=3082113 RepID=A0ACB0EJ32_RANTA|nr:unnamed protein product [Rangifer tarandus platyrhynchus]
MVPAGGGRGRGARAQGRSGWTAGMGPGRGRRAALDALLSPAAGSCLAPPSRCAAEPSAATAASCWIPPASRCWNHRPLRAVQPRPLCAARVRAHTGPSSALPLGLVRHRESFQNPPVKLRLAARGSGGAGALIPGLARVSQGALGVARRPAPRPERAPAPPARCGVSVSPAGFSPLRWSGK